MANPKITIYQDTRKPKANGLSSLKLRLYYNTVARHYLLPFELSEADFFQCYLTQKPRKEFQKLRKQIMGYEVRANEVLDELYSFSFEAFEKNYFRATGDGENLVWHYEQYVQKLKAEDRVKTAISYDLSLKSILSFYNRNKVKGKESKVLLFGAVTTDFLNQYEKWMLSQGKALTTVGIYTRSLRAIFNNAIADGVIHKDVYPFGKKKFQIPAGRNVKKALGKADLKALYEHPVVAGGVQEKAKDFWFFSYQCNGMNMRDIAELKRKNYNNNTLVFIRSKTKNTTRSNSKPVIVPVTDFTKRIIDKYGRSKGSQENYIFPILEGCGTEAEKVKAVDNFTRFVNQHIKIIAKEAGIEDNISTYWARHSFATMLKRNGANTSLIGEMLGHQHDSTTENYLDSFEDNIKREYSEQLMNF